MTSPTKGTTSQTLATLLRKGLVEARTSGEDRRVVHLSLTEAGRGVLARIADEGMWPDTCSDLPARDPERLSDLLATLLHRLQAAHGRRTFGVCASCRHLRHGEHSGMYCNLTGAPLIRSDTDLICREHEDRPVADLHFCSDARSRPNRIR